MNHHLFRGQVSSTRPPRTRGGPAPTYPRRPGPGWWAAILARGTHLRSSRTCGHENPREATHSATARAPAGVARAPAGSSSQAMPPAHPACPCAPEPTRSGMKPLGAAVVAPYCTVICQTNFRVGLEGNEQPPVQSGQSVAVEAEPCPSRLSRDDLSPEEAIGLPQDPVRVRPQERPCQGTPDRPVPLLQPHSGDWAPSAAARYPRAGRPRRRWGCCRRRPRPRSRAPPQQDPGR